MEFVLREEARFSDGSPVTVEDVMWSYETLGTKGHGRYRGSWGKVASMEQTGPRSVKFTFSVEDRELALIMGLRPILKQVVMRDKEGKPLRDHPVRVDAKTGTLNFVSGLAGYMTAEDGREMVFAIFAADMDIRAGISRAERERPPGGRTWNRKAKRVQQALIERWDALYGAEAVEGG